jgi:hypothetical protein
MEPGQLARFPVVDHCMIAAVFADSCRHTRPRARAVPLPCRRRVD